MGLGRSPLLIKSPKNGLSPMKEIKLFRDGVLIASASTENYDKCYLSWQAGKSAFLAEVEAYILAVLGGEDSVVNIKLTKN